MCAMCDTALFSVPVSAGRVAADDWFRVLELLFDPLDQCLTLEALERAQVQLGTHLAGPRDCASEAAQTRHLLNPVE